MRAWSVVILMKFGQNPSIPGWAIGTNVVDRKKKKERIHKRKDKKAFRPSCKESIKERTRRPSGLLVTRSRRTRKRRRKKWQICRVQRSICTIRFHLLDCYRSHAYRLIWPVLKFLGSIGPLGHINCTWIWPAKNTKELSLSDEVYRMDLRTEWNIPAITSIIFMHNSWPFYGTFI